MIGVNRAWGFKDYNWWKLPLKNLFMIGILISALVLGLLAPLIIKLSESDFSPGAKSPRRSVPVFLPPAILFYGLLMFYKFAPRRSVRFGQVWVAALVATAFSNWAGTSLNRIWEHSRASMRSMVFSGRSWDCSSGSISPE